MSILKLYAADYFDEQTEMHYALLQSADKIGPVLHTHDFFEIFMLIDGQIKHIVNEQHIILHAGALTLIRPEDVHYYRPIPHHNCQIINLAFSQNVIKELFQFLGKGFPTQQILDTPLPPTIYLTQDNKQNSQAKMERLTQISASQKDEKRTALRILLFELMTYFTNFAPLEKSTSMPDWLQHVCEAMQKPENHRQGVKRMVALANVTPEHLARTVRRCLQQSPTAYINGLRMTHAMNLLKHSDRPIIDIADEVGFESLSHFYALFKKSYGQTPRQFRQRYYL